MNNNEIRVFEKYQTVIKQEAHNAVIILQSNYLRTGIGNSEVDGAETDYLLKAPALIIKKHMEEASESEVARFLGGCFRNLRKHQWRDAENRNNHQVELNPENDLSCVECSQSSPRATVMLQDELARAKAIIAACGDEDIQELVATRLEGKNAESMRTSHGWSKGRLWRANQRLLQLFSENCENLGGITKLGGKRK